MGTVVLADNRTEHRCTSCGLVVLVEVRRGPNTKAVPAWVELLSPGLVSDDPVELRFAHLEVDE